MNAIGEHGWMRLETGSEKSAAAAEVEVVEAGVEEVVLMKGHLGEEMVAGVPEVVEGR